MAGSAIDSVHVFWCHTLDGLATSQPLCHLVKPTTCFHHLNFHPLVFLCMSVEMFTLLLQGGWASWEMCRVHAWPRSLGHQRRRFTASLHVWPCILVLWWLGSESRLCWPANGVREIGSSAPWPFLWRLQHLFICLRPGKSMLMAATHE